MKLAKHKCRILAWSEILSHFEFCDPLIKKKWKVQLYDVV